LAASKNGRLGHGVPLWQHRPMIAQGRLERATVLVAELYRRAGIGQLQPGEAIK